MADMDTMGSVLLSLVLAAMVTMESERLNPAMDIMAMVTMESERLNPALDIMAMDFHITEAMCTMANSNGRLASQKDTQDAG